MTCMYVSELRHDLFVSKLYEPVMTDCQVDLKKKH